jgi:hypothetical protein
MWLSEGDAPARFFHAHANNRRRKNHIHSLSHDGRVLVAESDKADVAFSFYGTLLGSPVARTNLIKLLEDNPQCIKHPHDVGADNRPGHLKETRREAVGSLVTTHISSSVKSVPSSRRSACGRSSRSANCDTRSLHVINQALLVLLPKSSDSCTIKDFRPISLIHAVGKLIFKALANRLAPRLGELSPPQPERLYQGMLDDNFRFVQASARLISARRQACLLFKVDISKAFDSVA